MIEKIFILTDKIEFVPDKDLERELNFNLRAAGYVYNKTLEYSAYRENLVKEFHIGENYKVDRNYTQKVVRQLKRQKPFLKKAESTCLQASTDRLIQAYNGYYEHRTGRPKFKSLKNNPVRSITLRNNEYPTKNGVKSSIMWKGNELRLNKLGFVKVKHKRDINGKIKEATILKENGKWFVCITYELEKIQPKEKFTDPPLYVGIDVGLRDFLTFSNDKVIPKPDLGKINSRIVYYQQKLARQKEGGSNWKKTLEKLHKWQNRRNNVVNDYYHKVSYNIVKHCQFIAMETLDIRGMLKSNLSHGIHEIGWGKLIEMIKYKAEWYGREFVQISRWFPSSKKCNFCGHINHDLGPEREWECPHCHTVHKRDVNAAKNILDEGLRATGSMVLCLVDFIPMGQGKILYKYQWKCFDKTQGMA
ncbi:MAG: transposase [Methanobrevibacter sp.]|nr:transposase [Methanobrevibacter sp.]